SVHDDERETGKPRLCGRVDDHRFDDLRQRYPEGGGAAADVDLERTVAGDIEVDSVAGAERARVLDNDVRITKVVAGTDRRNRLAQGDVAVVRYDIVRRGGHGDDCRREARFQQLHLQAGAPTEPGRSSCP